ncbi:unnamed protein product [Miscanthus lutarioriparius]|uniref:Uncharacterized protein n=1 Tax=Miscanthus lutarioriparius TaxID=422564 RepID=A0A811QKJ7_9POAL|nr:unnamed protein product [Miscanthus lutarioriparius]
MLANKRDGGDLAGSSNANKRTRSFLSGDDLYWYANKGIWSELGEKRALKLSKSVVSLALSDGHTVLFSFSGIVVEELRCGYRFLTSASLIRALKEHDDLKIEVRHEQNVVIGFLEEYDLDHEIAVVKITSSLNLNAVFLHNVSHYQPYNDVVSLGRDISGKLLATTGKLTPISSGSDRRYLMFSSCKLSEFMEGGPLFDCHGAFVGMNLVPSMEKSFFLPVHLISERLKHFETTEERAVFLARVNELKPERVGGTPTDIPDSHPKVAPDKDHYRYLEVLGYPRPTKSGMTLVNTFEEPFGDIYHHGVWKQLSRGVSEKIHHSVVTLASFKGDERFFACSGTFIDWDGKFQYNGCQIILTSACLVRNPDYPYDEGNKIVDGLRIKVSIPGKKRRKGTLIHCNLHYNVALVSVKTSSAVSLPVVRHARENLCSKLVVAVGRCFKSGDLMASSGELAPHWSGPFDFKRLLYSTCRIKKAGIGGPLVDAEGNYIGMNFYDQKVGNPVLFCDDIVDILDRFKKGTAAELDNDLTRWPVPWPKWLRPGDRNGLMEWEQRIIDSGCPYNYSGGDIFIVK